MLYFSLHIASYLPCLPPISPICRHPCLPSSLLSPFS